jgi:cell division transport system permease protein
MKRYDTSYFFREGIRGLFLHGFTSFAAICVTVACLIIMGSFVLVAFNLDNVIRQAEQQSELLVFIDESYTSAQARSVQSRVNLLDNVMDSVFVDRAEALDDFKNSLGENQDLVEGFDPLRHRYRVFLRDISLMSETVEQLRAITGVADVSADETISEGLISARRIINTVSVTLIVVLMGVSVFIISNTVKLATFDRREEIAIMRIVGATNAFIRWPFVVEGFLLGLTAGALAFVLQWALYSYVTGTLLRGIAVTMMVSFGELFLPMLAAFALTGFLVGVGGSLLTIRKFLRV